MTEVPFVVHQLTIVNRDVLLRHQRGHRQATSAADIGSTARQNGKRTPRDEMTGTFAYNTSEQSLSFSATPADENIIPAVFRSSPLAMSLPEDHYESNRSLEHDLAAKRQNSAWNDGSMYTALPSTAKISQLPEIQVNQMENSGSYEKSTHHVSATPNAIDFPVERAAEHAHNAIVFNTADTDADILDLLLSFPGDQMPGAENAVHDGPAVPWSENGISDRLTADSCSETGSASYSDHFSQKVTRIQNLWSPPQRTTVGTPVWYELALGSSDNIFSSHDHGAPIGSSNEARFPSSTETWLTHEIKIQLRSLKRSLLRRQCSCSWSDTHLRDTCDQHYFCQNSSDIFEQGLYLYLDKYQPTYPLLHVPTFDAQAVQPLQLLLMCSIGLSFVKTEEAARFIYHIYPALLDEVYTQVISATPESSNPAAMLSRLILAHHMLYLVVVTEATISPTKSQMLYRYTLTAAQRLGLFCSNIDPVSDVLSTVHEEYPRWKSWSRVESLKNLALGLILHDSSLSGIFSISPVISADTLYLALPCDFDLYRARSAREWMQLNSQGFSVTAPTMKLSHNEYYLPDLPKRVHISCLYGPMCAIIIRLTTNYHRLILGSDLAQEDQHQYTPWRIYSLDRRASMANDVVVRFYQLYDTILRDTNPNCVVIWHNLCLHLTTDIRLLERAAGREGPDAMQAARQAIGIWAKTSAARRACLHAAQIFNTFSNWKPTDGTGFQPVRCLFLSALVLSLYILVGSRLQDVSDNDGFDLARTDVDWKAVGEEGLADGPLDQTEQLRKGLPAVNFIRFGGPIRLCGKTYFMGARHARRLILDFASLLDEVGKHWMAKYPRLLYMIHDTIMDVNAEAT
ncbi:hypothetical protein BBP40_011979 [Aspergillus hancockii]|nr:hypothetical protein BBP40_011979 [Aspergillus hancockii]